MRYNRDGLGNIHQRRQRLRRRTAGNGQIPWRLCYCDRLMHRRDSQHNLQGLFAVRRNAHGSHPLHEAVFCNSKLECAGIERQSEIAKPIGDD